MDEKNNVAKTHKVLLSNRKSGAFSGVVDVLSFDVAEILLETELGMLLIKGHDLHVNRLTLEKGEVDIEGRIDSLTYSDVKTADEIDFNIGKVSDFYRSLAYPIEAYKFSKDDEYDDIIVYRTNDSLTESHEWANSNMMMVDSVYDAIDDNGTQTKEISGIISGNMARYTLAESMKAESFSADNIHCGDLIRCRFNSHGQINHIQLLYCADTKTRNGWAEESNTGIYFDKSFGANFQLSFGYVYERGKNVITWGTSIGGDATEAYDITYVPVMVYDASKRDDKVYKGTIDDIAGYDNVGADCDTVILQSMEGVGKALAVFKK